MKLVFITDEVKRKAKEKGSTKTVSVPEKVLVEKQYSQPNKTTFVAPITAKYKVEFDIYAFNPSVMRPDSYEETKEFNWQGDSKHNLNGLSVDDWKLTPRGAVISYSIKITQLPSTTTITVPPPPLPSYNLYIIKDRQALPYKALIKVGG